MGTLSALTKEKRADRRKAKKNPPCPHNWVADAKRGAGYVCTMCNAWTTGDGKVQS